VVNHHSN